MAQPKDKPINRVYLRIPDDWGLMTEIERRAASQDIARQMQRGLAPSESKAQRRAWAPRRALPSVEPMPPPGERSTNTD